MTKSIQSQKLRPGTSPLVRVARDMIGRAHMKPGDDLSNRAARFRALQLQFMKGKFNHWQADLKLSLCFILFDLLITREDILRAIENAHLASSWNCRSCIDWQDNIGRINRRILSPFTRRILKEFIGKPLSANSLLMSLDSMLAGQESGIGDVLTLFGDAQAWAFEVLPGPLFVHCTNLIPLSCVPATCLARHASRLALFNANLRHIVSDSAMDMALNGYFSPKQRDGGTWLVERIRSACRYRSNQSAASARSNMLKECLTLAPYCEEAGPLTSLLLAWVLDFIENGTPWHGIYQPGTIQDYVGAILSKLFEVFRNIDIEALDAAEFEARYARILDTLPPSHTAAARAAIAAWHHFLLCWFDVPELSPSVGDGLAQNNPRANVIWDHELELIDGWLAAATFDERLNIQIRVGLGIASEIRIRARELLRLRMLNVIIEGGRVAIEIARLKRDPRLKTDAGARFVEITDPGTVGMLTAWHNRRKFEGALSDDLFFGDPHDPMQGYQLGKMHRYINQLLKAATGDKTVSFHTLSHRWVSSRFEEALMTRTHSEINPLDQLSALAGHASSHISLVNYFHFVERLLRHFSDVALQSLPLTGEIVAAHSDITAAAFRKRCSRRSDSTSKQAVAWSAISSANCGTDLPDIVERFQLYSAEAPDEIFKKLPVGFKEILEVLSDLSIGKPLSETSSRCNLAEPLVVELAALGCDVMTQLGLLERSPGGLHSGAQAIARYQSAFDKHGRINFARVVAEKLAPLAGYLKGTPQRDAVRRAVASWIACYRNSYISIEQPAHAINLIKLLSAAHISSDKLLVRIAAPTTKLDEAKQLQAAIISVFLGAYGLPPTIDVISPRRGRPRAYLVLSSSKLLVGSMPSSAGVSMAGFNALMLVAGVQLNFNEGTTKVRSNNFNFESLETCHVRIY